MDYFKPNAALGKAVLAELSNITSIPETEEEGAVIIAGAAVLSAVSKLLNMDWINQVYNDVDLFMDINKKENENEFDEFIGRSRSVVATSFNGHIGYVENEYGVINLCKKASYHIKYTLRENMNNKVFFSFKNKPFNKEYLLEKAMKELVDNFDFNSVQVCVDVATGLLYGSEAFWEFLATRQFKIENLHTPSHSLIRFFRKKKEMGDGVFYNEKEIVTCCLIGIDKANRENLHNEEYSYVFFQDVPSNFGEETLQKAISVLDELEESVVIFKEEIQLKKYQTYKFIVNPNNDMYFEFIRNIRILDSGEYRNIKPNQT